MHNSTLSAYGLNTRTNTHLTTEIKHAHATSTLSLIPAILPFSRIGAVIIIAKRSNVEDLQQQCLRHQACGGIESLQPLHT